MLNFMSIGVSFEDFQIFVDEGDLNKFENRYYLFDSEEVVDFSAGLQKLNDYADNHFKYLEEQEYKDAVDKFTNFVEGKQGIFFNWSVEYDYELMFVEGVTNYEELVDILQKFKDELGQDEDE